MQRKLLNVGGGPVPVPAEYRGYDVDLLDIDASLSPDLCLDVRELTTLEPGQYDIIYASHILEHLHEHEIAGVLWGFYYVLGADGMADIRVPDARAVMLAVAQNNLDLDAVLYSAMVGPIRVMDVLWGWQKQIERSREDFYAHKCGFSRGILGRALKAAHFEYIRIGCSNYEIIALAYKKRPENV